MFEEIEKHEGFRVSPKSDGLIKRVAGPCVRPRGRTIPRPRRGGIDFAGATITVVPLKIAREEGRRHAVAIRGFALRAPGARVRIAKRAAARPAHCSASLAWPSPRCSSRSKQPRWCRRLGLGQRAGAARQSPAPGAARRPGTPRAAARRHHPGTRSASGEDLDMSARLVEVGAGAPIVAPFARGGRSQPRYPTHGRCAGSNTSTVGSRPSPPASCTAGRPNPAGGGSSRRGRVRTRTRRRAARLHGARPLLAQTRWARKRATVSSSRARRRCWWDLVSFSHRCRPRCPMLRANISVPRTRSTSRHRRLQSSPRRRPVTMTSHTSRPSRVLPCLVEDAGGFLGRRGRGWASGPREALPTRWGSRVSSASARPA